MSVSTAPRALWVSWSNERWSLAHTHLEEGCSMQIRPLNPPPPYDADWIYYVFLLKRGE